MSISLTGCPGLQLPGGGGGGGGAPVQPPASTTQAVAAGGSPANKTFAAFTDADSRIASYSAAMVNAVGTTSVSGSGLGAYTFSGSSNGDSFTLKLNALDSGGQVLATAVHAVDIAAANLTAQPPTPSTESVNSGSAPANYTFSSFTDSGGIISSYEATIYNVIGSTTIASGSGLGAYVFANYEDGDSFILVLDAKDAGGAVVASAVRSITIKPSTGIVAGSGLEYIFHVAAPTAVGVAGTLS